MLDFSKQRGIEKEGGALQFLNKIGFTRINDMLKEGLKRCIPITTPRVSIVKTEGDTMPFNKKRKAKLDRNRKIRKRKKKKRGY